MRVKSDSGSWVKCGSTNVDGSVLGSRRPVMTFSIVLTGYRTSWFGATPSELSVRPLIASDGD